MQAKIQDLIKLESKFFAFQRKVEKESIYTEKKISQFDYTFEDVKKELEELDRI